jgi:hypothetical protein
MVWPFTARSWETHDRDIRMSPFSIFPITQALMVYISACTTVMWSPRMKLCPLLDPIYTPQHQQFYWSWTHPYTRPGPLLTVLNPFWHSHFSVNLTMTCGMHMSVSPCSHPLKDGFMSHIPKLSSTTHQPQRVRQKIRNMCVKTADMDL